MTIMYESIDYYWTKRSLATRSTRDDNRRGLLSGCGPPGRRTARPDQLFSWTKSDKGVQFRCRLQRPHAPCLFCSG